MPRSNRLTQAGLLHHVIARGNANQDLFRDEEDYHQYISLLRKAVSQYPLYVYNFALMKNHLNLLVETKEEGSLSKAMENVTREYAKYFNQKYNSIGHVFAGRFKSFAVQDKQYFLACSRYIDLNPVKSNLVKDPKDYKWSGFGQLALGKPGEITLDQHDLYKALGNTPQERELVYRSLAYQQIGPELNLDDRKSGVLGDREFKTLLKSGVTNIRDARKNG